MKEDEYIDLLTFIIRIFAFTLFVTVCWSLIYINIEDIGTQRAFRFLGLFLLVTMIISLYKLRSWSEKLRKSWKLKSNELDALAKKLKAKDALNENLNNLVNTVENKNSLLENYSKEISNYQQAMINILEDVEEARQGAVDAMNAKSTFLANMSHEIRTPMNAILGFTEILLKKSEDPVTKENLKTIDSAGRTLLRILNDVLDLSKMESGKFTLNNQDFEFIEELHEIYKIFEIQANRKGVDFILDICDLTPKVICLDKVRFRQIITNLLSNSFKFTDQGHVRLETFIEKTGDKKGNIILDIIDTGPGIPHDMIEKIFEKFEQVEGHQGIFGTGLGLSISKQLAELMNGSLKALQTESGAHFRLTINDIEFKEKITQISHRSNKIYSFEPATVLVIDDNINNLKIVEGFLEDTELKTTSFKSPKKGLKFCKNHKPDFIIMDLCMEEMSGVDCANKIREINDYEPIIVVSSAFVEDQEKETFEEVFNSSLRKPFSKDQLLEKIAEFLHPKEIKEISEQNEEKEEISLTENRALLAKFISTFRDQMEECCKYMTINDFGSFFDEARNFATQNSWSEMHKWIEKVQNLLDTFEIDILVQEIEYLLAWENDYSTSN